MSDEVLDQYKEMYQGMCESIARILRDDGWEGAHSVAVSVRSKAIEEFRHAQADTGRDPLDRQLLWEQHMAGEVPMRTSLIVLGTEVAILLDILGAMVQFVHTQTGVDLTQHMSIRHPDDVSAKPEVDA